MEKMEWRPLPKIPKEVFKMPTSERERIDAVQLHVFHLPEASMTPLEIMDKRREAATKGPWYQWRFGKGRLITLGKGDKTGAYDGFSNEIGSVFRRGDGIFIAHSITDHERMSRALRYVLKELKKESQCYCNLPTYTCGYCLREKKIQSILEGKDE